MIRRLMQAAIRRFGRRYDYDTRYLAEIVDADLGGGLKLLRAQAFLRHDFGAPRDLYQLARVRSAFRADCGPCLALVVRMAREAGVAPDVLLPALGEGTAAAQLDLVIRFTDAVVDDGPDLPDLAEQVKASWGERVRMGLAAAIVAGQFYPTLKRALGHGVSCEPVAHSLRAVMRENGSGERRQ